MLLFFLLLDIHLPYIIYFLKQYCLKYKSKLKPGKLIIYSNMSLQHSKLKLEFLNLSVTYIILSPQGKTVSIHLCLYTDEMWNCCSHNEPRIKDILYIQVT